MKTPPCWCIAIVFLVTSALAAAADNPPVKEITVAAAADLSVAMKQLAEGYERESGVKVKLSFGASGALAQQIKNGAPFDIFFSADMDYPKQLISEGEADNGSLYRYAVGKLVLWAPADSRLDVVHGGMTVLTDRSIKKISIANPEHAPYGRAAVAAMKHIGIYDQVSSRLVMGENVSQAAQFVESGNAQVGFVALAHAVAPALKSRGKYWQIPDEAYPALDQGAVIIARSRHKQEAAAFLDYVKGSAAVAVLRRYGFDVPGQKK
jgi:molybdate transport system substrate-binding protein